MSRSLLFRILIATCLAGPPAVCRAADVAASPASGATPEAPPVAERVERQTRRLEENELRDLLAAALNERRGDDGAELELHLTRPWTPVTIPDQPLTVEILEPASARVTSTCILRFELRAGRELIGAWQTPVQAHLWREVLVAHIALQRGLPLDSADITHERRDVLALHDPLYELPPDAAAFELGESVTAGSALSARVVRPKRVVFRGQTADAVVRQGAMSISLKVEVMEEGVPGQMIRVRNIQSRRELRGKVQDEQTIALSL